MNSNEIKEYSKDWYDLGRNFLPEFDHPLFPVLAGKSNAFSYMENPDESDIFIRLTSDTETGYVDLGSKTIFISTKYFSKELYKNRFEDGGEKTEGLAIALINGTVIHEALHIKWSGRRNIPQTLELDSRYYEMKRKYGMDIVCTAFNIIEDIFIEGQVDKKLESWLQATSDILFSKADVEGQDIDLTQIENFLNLAILFKNKQLRNMEQFKAFSSDSMYYLDKVATGKRCKTLRTRVQITFDWLETFEGKIDSSDESDGSGGSSSEESDGSEKGELRAGSEMESALEGTGDIDRETKARIASEFEGSSDEITASVSDKESFTTKDGYDIYWNKLIEKDILKTYTSGLNIEPKSKINFNFLKELQAIRTLNRTPGQARTRGSVMVKSRLTRIATDGKIFAKRDAERQQLKRIEVIINVDLSGSTMGRVANEEFGAAMEMSKVLRNSGIAHSVYGHTSTDGPGGEDTPALFHIYSFDMTTTNHDWDKRFKKALHISLRQNYDGVVINRLAERFTNKSATKYMINLSDGQPAAPGYSGKTAIDHTMKAIKDAREKNIAVFSISVVKGVVRTNDNIYGAKFNIDGSQNVTSQFRKLIKKIVGG